MERLSLTPFGRQPVTAGQIAAQALSDIDIERQPVSKWDVLRDATTARTALGITDRDLCVLQALLSFHPRKELDAGGPIVVFPSNKTLSARAHGMAESTLRRHVAKLVNTGLILRHDSPNGKRYARKGQGGIITLAFGFDLSPLLHRSVELADLAQTARMEAQMLSELRERCVLLVRDAAKLLAYIKDAPVRLQNGLRDAQRCLRRKPTKDGLEALMGACKQLVTSLRRIVETENPSGNGVQNERHKQCQKPDYFDSEKAMITKPNRAVPLPFILKACPEITKYATGPIQNWASMIHQATYIKTLIGISEDAWSDACLRIGACEAATILAYMLERLSKIQNPGGYLRVLTKEAERDGLCLNLMIASLLNQGKQSTAGVES